MDNYDFAVIFFYFLSAVASLVHGISGFGDAIILHMGWNIAVALKPELQDTILGTKNVELIAILVSLRVVFVGGALTYMTRAGFSKAIFLRFMPAECIGVLLGAWIGSWTDDAVLKPLLGVVFLLCGVFYLAVKGKQYYARQGQQEEEQQQTKERSEVAAVSVESPTEAQPEMPPGAVVAEMPVVVVKEAIPQHLDAEGNIHPRILQGAIFFGGVAGLGLGMTGVGGPAMMLFVLWYELPPAVARGTIPAATLVAGGFRLVYTQVTGGYHYEAWLLYAAVLVGGLMGLFVGNEIGRRMTEIVFTFFLQSLLLLACISMLGVSPFIVLIMGVVCVVGVYAVHVWDRERRRRIAEAEEDATGEEMVVEADGDCIPCAVADCKVLTQLYN
jgi:uncharacterized membrane protein YfcA